MHWTQSNSQIIQEKCIHECKNDPKRRWLRLIIRSITKKTFHLSQSSQQRCRLQLLVGCRHSLKQILHHKRHVIELFRNRSNPSSIIKQRSFLGSTVSNSNRPWFPNNQNISIHVRQSSHTTHYRWGWTLRWISSKFDSDWLIRIEKSLWGDGWGVGWILTLRIDW